MKVIKKQHQYCYILCERIRLKGFHFLWLLPGGQLVCVRWTECRWVLLLLRRLQRVGFSCALRQSRSLIKHRQMHKVLTNLVQPISAHILLTSSKRGSKTLSKSSNQTLLSSIPIYFSDLPNLGKYSTFLESLALNLTLNFLKTCFRI